MPIRLARQPITLVLLIGGMLASCMTPNPPTDDVAATITAIAAGGSHSAAVVGDGALYTWGANNDGQLGDGAAIWTRNTPASLPAFPPPGTTITRIATAAYHSAALLSDGTLYTWGRNAAGELGDGTFTPKSRPTLVPDFPPTGTTITTIVASSLYTAALLSDGTLSTWGANGNGQLGDGTRTSSNTPTRVPDFPPSGTTVTAVATGGGHTSALLSDGTLYTWGVNSSGQLGDGTNEDALSPNRVPDFPPPGTTITSVANGGVYSAAILSNGALYTWGSNNFGQLGIGTRESKTTPTLVPDFPPAGTTITTIATGGSYTVALLSDGSLYTWGWNQYGQLGTGTTANEHTPTRVPNYPPTGTTITAIAVGGLHAAALLDDDSLYAWGNNATGQIGDGTDASIRTSPTRVVGIGDGHAR